MVFDSSDHDPLPGFETVAYKHVNRSDARDLGYIDHWRATKQILPGKVTLNDYDFEKPRAKLEVQKEPAKEHAHAEGPVYQYPGHYVEPSIGADQATVRLEEAQVAYAIAHGSSQAKWFSPGILFSLEKHPRDDQNVEYLVVSAGYDIDAGPFSSNSGATARMNTRFTVLSSQTPFRPGRSTPVPFVSGPQTAMVVGPKGQELWTDEHGRIKVQFAWDRRGNAMRIVRVGSAFLRAGLDPVGERSTYRGSDRRSLSSLWMAIGTTTSIKLDLATLTIIGPKVDINPIGAISPPQQPVTSKAAEAGAPDEDPAKEEFKGGGGSFGGGCASGDF